MSSDVDLFGNRPAQGSLFGSGKDRMGTQRQETTPDPESIRLRLTALLEKAMSAREMPWPAREARMWQTVFPSMANWLPKDEADQLRLQFSQQIARLQKGV